jgi:PPOX class probable F420-dependent enzyme
VTRAAHYGGTVSIRLSDDEAWRVLADSHTGILTSLRRDGVPVSLPVWFVVDGRTILVAGPSSSYKFLRLRRDPRVAFLVESGQAWKDLTAVHLIGVAEMVDQPDWDSVDERFDAKYANFRTARADMPASARARYDGSRSLVRLTPTERLLTWDNRRLEGR